MAKKKRSLKEMFDYFAKIPDDRNCRECPYSEDGHSRGMVDPCFMCGGCPGGRPDDVEGAGQFVVNLDKSPPSKKKVENKDNETYPY